MQPPGVSQQLGIMAADFTCGPARSDQSRLPSYIQTGRASGLLRLELGYFERYPTRDFRKAIALGDVIEFFEEET
jgi:hypothetical protein